MDTNNIFSNVGNVVGYSPGSEPGVGPSGTLIHPRVFLTAGHVTAVLEQMPLSEIYISFGNSSLDPTTWREIEAVITHPNYRDVGMNNPHVTDLGVVILKQPVENVLPANLPLFSRHLQLPIPLGVDLQLTPGEHVLRGDVANRAVQPDVVVTLDISNGRRQALLALSNTTCSNTTSCVVSERPAWVLTTNRTS